MSVKHVKDYYNKITNDYLTMKDALKELENASMNNPALTNNIQTIKTTVDKMKENYNRISYIVYLLNMPNKKEKRKKYTTQFAESLKAIPEDDRLSGVHSQDIELIGTIKNLSKN